MHEQRAVIAPQRPVAAAPRTASAERLISLDAFRGIAIAGMILVNNPGDPRNVYDPLQHSVWNGCTLADLIFPFFLFIVGSAVALSFAHRVGRGQRRVSMYGKILWRTAIIFGLGLVLNAFPIFDPSSVRILGVLQRIALCYCAASIVVLTVGVRGQVALTAALLVGYWAAMKLIPVPDFGDGNLGPANNLAAYVDTLLLSDHLAHRFWDPEGVLTTVPAIATTLIGVLAGQWMRLRRSPLERATGLFISGNVCVLLGVIADRWFPISKNLWSPSFVLFTAGVALSLLGSCYWLIDIQGYRRWATPFVIYGMNPLVAYFLSTLASKTIALWRIARPDGSHIVLRHYLFDHVFLPLASPIDASLLYAVAYVLLWLAAMAILYRRRIFVKI